MRTESQLSSKLLRSLSKVLGTEVVSFWLEQAGSTQATDRCLAEVVSIDRETADAVSLWLKPNSLFPGFEAGQYVNIGMTVNGVVHTRSYSFSASPRQDGLVRLTIKKSPNGVVSTHAVEGLKTGTLIELGDVFGDMTMSHTQPNLAEQGASMLLLAAGSGITPMMSLIDSLNQQGWPAKATLVYWARNPQDVIFDSTFAKLAAENDNFTYVRALEEGANTDMGDFQGRPSAEQFKQLGIDLSLTDVYACGPDGFMKALQSLIGTKAKSFHAESFTPATLAIDPNAEVKTFPITLSLSNRVVEVPNNKPLLKALLDQGINAPHGCGMGICNTCSCEKLLGTTQNLQNQTVCASGNTALRLCVNAAQSPLTLEL